MPCPAVEESGPLGVPDSTRQCRGVEQREATVSLLPLAHGCAYESVLIRVDDRLDAVAQVELSEQARDVAI
jgi:hypothetical protein